MSIDLFACHAVQQAVLQGDVDADAGVVLSMLPRTMQESSLNQLKLLSSMATASQLVNALQFKSVDLSKADFDKSNCRDCLHNSSVSNTYLETHQIEFKPHHCLFALCAQHDALDGELLSQRSVVDGIEDALLVSDADDEVIAEVFVENAQMDLGVPDIYDEAPLQEHEPMDVQLHEVDLPHAVVPGSEVCAAIEVPATGYLDVVRNAWWRDALKHRLTEVGTHHEAQSFVLACLATNSVKDVLSSAPAILYSELCSGEGNNTVLSLAAMFADEIALENVRAFLKVMKVDLTLTGCISEKVLCALSIGELSVIATHFDLQETDEMCSAYANGVAEFAHWIAETVGSNSLSDYIPPSLQP